VSEGDASPQFSVIVTTFNRPEFLSQALRSVLSQTVEDLECIVVDDGGSVPVQLPDDPRVRLVRLTENRGAPASRNAGIDAATGRFVAFLDDDDEFTPGRLAIAAEGLKRAPVAVCWLSQLETGKPGGRVILEGDVSDVILDGITPNTGRAVVERSLLPHFDENLDFGGEDVEWWLRLSRIARVATVPEVGYLWRVHDGPRRHSDETFLRARLQILESNEEYFASHPIARSMMWRRIALLAHRLGDMRTARAAYLRAFRAKPLPKTAAGWVRCLCPSSASIFEGLPG
jgi:glycosyltransferase involved in cell wall biosynthesis